MLAIELQNINFNYRNSETLFENFTLRVAAGDFVFLLGANGSGKSSLLKLILGAVTPQRGTVVLSNKANPSAKLRAQHIGYVPQSAGLDPEMNASDTLNFIGSSHNLIGTEFEKIKKEIIQSLGLNSILDKRIKKLSGGQQQLINIAVALLHNPSILLLDEPFVGLDYGTKSNLVSMLKSLGKTIICISHEIDFAEQNADKVLLLEKGNILQYDKPATIVSLFPYYISEIDLKKAIDHDKKFAADVQCQKHYNRITLTCPNEEAAIKEVEEYITGLKDNIMSQSTFQNNLKSTLVGKYQISFSADAQPKKNKRKK